MHPAFTVHKLNDRGLIAAHTIAASFDDLLVRCYAEFIGHDPAEIVRDHSPEQIGAMIQGARARSREFATAITKLEEACFFMKKAIANQPENQLHSEIPHGGL